MQGHCLLNVDNSTKLGGGWAECLLSTATDAKDPIWLNSMLQEPLYLSVCRRNVPASIHPQQRVVGEREIELDVGRMVHGHIKPPEKAWWDCLALLSSDVDLTTVNGTASHPLLCR